MVELGRNRKTITFFEGNGTVPHPKSPDRLSKSTDKTFSYIES